jgi:hypothetical protein
MISSVPSSRCEIGERPDLVVGDDAACIADHMRVALVQPEQAVRVQAGVHAGDDRDALRRR